MLDHHLKRIAPRLLNIVPSSQPAQGPNAQWELRNAGEPGAVSPAGQGADGG